MPAELRSEKLEQELKLLVDPETFSVEGLLAGLAAQPGVRVEPAEQLRVRDVYLDTRDRKLARSGLSARWRTRQGRGSLQVKAVPLVHGLLLERFELHRDLARGEDAGVALRALLEERLSLRVRGRLLPEVELRSRREVHRVELGGAGERSLVELSLDEVTAVRPGARSGPRFRELEVELQQGSEHGLRELAGWIVAQPGVTPSERSKHRRALELLGLTPPRLAPATPQLGPLASADGAARAIAGAQLGAITGYEPGTRLGLDPEYLHKMRVATRRLRAALRTFAVCFPTGRARIVLRELKWLADALGAVRDLDVQILGIVERQAALGAAPEEGWVELRAALEARRQRARSALVVALDAARYQRLLARAAELFGETPRRAPGHAGARPVVEMAAEALDRRAKKLARAARECRREPSSGKLHQLRIRGKKLRYACEFFGPLFGAELAPQVERLARFQDALGLFQDSVVTGRLAEELRDEGLRGGGSGAYLHVLGLLVGQSRTKAAGAGAELERANAELGGARAVRGIGRVARRRLEEVRAAIALTGLKPDSAPTPEPASR